MSGINVREYRRKRAMKMLEKGWKQEQIAQALGVSQGAVSQWKRRFSTEGANWWKDKPIPGAPPRLSPSDEEQLAVIVANGATEYGFTGNFWTHKRISRVVEEQFEQELGPKQCGRILKKLNLTRQRPQRHCTSQQIDQVVKWKQEQLPALKKIQED